jgi:hypothetical protein
LLNEYEDPSGKLAEVTVRKFDEFDLTTQAL